MQKCSNNGIFWLDIVDSTNDEAKRQIHSLNHLAIVSAYQQTAGRGQRGNTWSSEAGKNLTFSIIIKYCKDGYGNLLPSGQFIISKIAALSIVNLLNKYGIDAEIKWPNDIYVHDKKIAGILIEHALRHDTMVYSIVGIGLNVNQITFGSELYNPTSIRIESHLAESLDLNIILEDFVNIFKNILEQRSVYELDSLYHSRLWRLNIKANFIDYTSLPNGVLDAPIVPNQTNIPHAITFSGIIRGVSDIGELIVEDDASSELHRFGFKEIGYII